MEPVSGCNVMGPGSSKEEDQPLSIKMLTWRDEKPSQEAATSYRLLGRPWGRSPGLGRAGADTDI